jgi:IS5 family transposase
VVGVFRVAVLVLDLWCRENRLVTLGRADRQGDLFDEVVRFCEELLPDNSVYAFLARERERLFSDEMFADLFTGVGRRSVPPSVVATVMVLQRLEGLSDREAVERYAFDARWRYAAGVGGYGGSGWARFAHTVLVDMRERLRRSTRPDRVFEVALRAAGEAGVVGRRRVLDSTPLYDAVATMDTLTLIRSALRGLFKVADTELEAELRAVCSGCDEYLSASKPRIDWDDVGAREELVDSRARDGYAVLAVLHGRKIGEAVEQAAALLATVLGQDLESGEDEVFRIARRVEKDRVISCVDSDARHGHKTSSRGFDGYKGHAAVDPDSEIITATTVTAGNVGDAAVAEDLIADLLTESTDGTREPEARLTVYGDAAYGTGELQQRLGEAGIASRCKTQAPSSAGGLFSKDRFDIDLDALSVSCPAGESTAIRLARAGDGSGIAYFGPACAGCRLRAQCTGAKNGRTIAVGVHERVLAQARTQQADPAWLSDYRATRPKVERKLGHLMRRRHGGRRARVRGTDRVDADFRLLAAAVNLARLAVLGLRGNENGWVVAA